LAFPFLMLLAAVAYNRRVVNDMDSGTGTASRRERPTARHMGVTAASARSPTLFYGLR